MTTNNSSSVVSAAAISALFNAVTMTAGEKSIRFDFAGKFSKSTQMGKNWDAGMSAIVLRALVHIKAETYTRNDFYYFGGKDIKSLSDLKNAGVIVDGAGNYAVGCDGLRAEIAMGTFMYDHTIVDGAVYRMSKEGRALKLSRMNQMFLGEGVYMSDEQKHELNARKLIEALDLIYMALDAGTSISVMYNNSSFIALDLIDAIKSVDPKAAAKAILSNSKAKAHFNKTLDGAMFVASNPTKNDKYAAKVAAMSVATAKIDGKEFTASELVGRSINSYHIGDAAKTPTFFGGDVEVDSIEYAMALIKTENAAHNQIVITK